MAVGGGSSLAKGHRDLPMGITADRIKAVLLAQGPARVSMPAILGTIRHTRPLVGSNGRRVAAIVARSADRPLSGTKFGYDSQLLRRKTTAGAAHWAPGVLDQHGSGSSDSRAGSSGGG